jgi:hypothetical protein
MKLRRGAESTMDIMDAARQAEEGAADFACRDIMHWRYEGRKKAFKGEGGFANQEMPA